MKINKYEPLKTSNLTTLCQEDRRILNQANQEIYKIVEKEVERRIKQLPNGEDIVTDLKDNIRELRNWKDKAIFILIEIKNLYPMIESGKIGIMIDELLKNERIY